ncbi:MAG: SDR family NAD(P)-dependent oxidoreductase, partial [Anaerolineae bacterium]
IAEANETTGRTAAESLRAEGGSAQFEPLDVRDPQQSAALVDKLAGQRGHIDVWVNNAGISRLAPAETMPLSDWDDSIAVMLSGTFYCSQAVGRHMLARGKGVIVNIASVTGMVHHHDRAAYSVAKAGVIALTEALGVEWAGRGVRVVGVAPAVVLTEMVRATVEAGQGALDVFERRTPMRRLGTPEEIAEAVFFLAGDEASYITAETMRVDGGWVAYQLF